VLALVRRPLARDSLVAMFWGDQDEDRARHSLSNALSSLRRSLGARAITTREAEVALDSELPLDVDALEFADAIEGQEAGRGIDLYGGPFLDGLHVDDAPAFEQWMARERRRLEALCIRACARQCETLARGRRWTECHALAARWIDAEPLSTDAAIYLLNATKAPGTRASLALALEEYDQLRGRLARDFDVKPDPPVRGLADALREQLATQPPDPEPRPAPAVAAAPPVIRPELDVDPVPDEADASQTATPEMVPSATDRAPPAQRLRRPVAAMVLAIAAIALVFGGRAAWQATRRVRGSARKPVIALLGLRLRTDDSAQAWLADGLPHLIVGKLARTAAIEVVAEPRIEGVVLRSGHLAHDAVDDATARDLARRLGATLVVRGAIGLDGANLVLDLTVHDVETGGLVTGAVLTTSNALLLADEAAARILSAANVTAPGPQLAGLETTSLEAYQSYLRALDANKAGRITEYVQAIDEALALDSGFFAALRAREDVAMARNDTGRLRQVRNAMQKHADRATAFDRMLTETLDAFYAGEHERSEALGRAFVRRFPRDPRAYATLGQVLGGHGRVEETEEVALRDLALDSLAIDAGSGPCAPCRGLVGLAQLRWSRNDLRGAADWARRAIRAQPDGAMAWAALAWSYSYLQMPDSALPLMQRAVSLSGGDVWASEEYVRMLLVARRYEAADSAITLLEASGSPARKEGAADLRSLLQREHGQYRAATRTIEAFLRAVPGPNGFADMMLASNPRALGDYTGAARRYELGMHGPSGIPLTLPILPAATRAFCWHHALAADALAPSGDTATLRAVADTLERVCGRSYYARDWRLFHHVRGLVALQGRRYAEAERELQQAVWTPVEGWARTTVELANAQMGLGHPLDAVETLRMAHASRLDAMARYVPISEIDYRMALAFAQAGVADSALAYAAYARRAWQDADPEVRRLLARLP
jgi:DNA-binding SARP family transcriptional activator/TolB-like protein